VYPETRMPGPSQNTLSAGGCRNRAERWVQTVYRSCPSGRSPRAVRCQLVALASGSMGVLGTFAAGAEIEVSFSMSALASACRCVCFAAGLISGHMIG
jgi:hypothetical protein